MLDEGLSTDTIYNALNNDDVTTIGETIKDPKFIDNRIHAKKLERQIGEIRESEAETILKSVKTGEFLQSVTFNDQTYSTINYTPQMMEDIKRFCVFGGGILSVDTTFELCDGLWLTDTTYPNLSLLNRDGKHPEFPGPSFWHFSKSREAYRRFAAEMVVAEPTLMGIKKVGHALDKAIARGFKDIFNVSSSLWCTQHIKGRDENQLRTLGCRNPNDISRILADIYGTQNQV